MPQISVTKLMQRVDDGQVDPLYVFYGDESYLIHEYILACVNRILATAPRDFNYDVFEANSDTLTEALGIARTLPMMAQHRVVVLHGVHQLRKPDLEHLDDYATQPSESTAVICSSADNDLKKLPGGFRQRAMAIECKHLEGAKLRAWVVKVVKQQGYTITPDAVRTFVQEQQGDLQTMKGELEKLCTYAGDTEQIGQAEVEAVCQASYMHSIFKLSDAIGARQTDQAIALTSALLHQGEPPLVVFSMMVRHLRLLWSIRHLVQQRQDIPDIARTLHLPQRVCRQIATQSRQLPVARLQQLYTAAVEADMTFKTTNKPAKAILEDLILELCAQP